MALSQDAATPANTTARCLGEQTTASELMSKETIRLSNGQRSNGQEHFH